MTDTQAQTTRFCARVIGPLMLVVGAIVVARFDTVARMISGILADEPLAFVTGLFTLIIGMILFVAHHHWSSVTAIVVSLLGLLTMLRGIILMLAPGLAADVATRALEAGPGAWVAGGVAILIGAWLSYAGWFAKQV